MAINRFDTPAQYQAINTYVPIPFEQMAQAAMYRQNKADQQAAKIDEAYNKAAALDYIKNSQDQAKIEQYQRAIDEMATKYSDPKYDTSDPMVAREINSAISRNLNNQEIQAIQKSAQAYAANEKYKAQLKANGKYNQILDEDPNAMPGGYDTATMGIYGYQTPAWEQYRPVAEEYFNDIKDSILRDPVTNKMIHSPEGYTMTGVDEAKIKEVTKSKVTSFLDSNAGKQQVRIARNRLERLYGKDKVDKISDEKLAYDTLLEVGEEYIREGLTGSRYPQGSGNAPAFNPYNLPAIFEGDNINQDWDPYGINEESITKEIDANKDKYPDYYPPSLTNEEIKNNINPETGYLLIKAPTNSEYSKQNKEKIRNDIRNERLEQFRNDFGISKEYTTEELLGIYKDVKKDLQTLNSSIMSVPVDYANETRQDLRNTIFNREITLVGDDGNLITGKIGTSQQIEDEIRKLGFEDSKDFIDQLGDPTNSTFAVEGFSTTTNIPGSISLKVNDTKNKGYGKKGWKTIEISTSLGNRANMTNANNMMRAYNTAQQYQSPLYPAAWLTGQPSQNSYFSIELDPHTGINNSETKEGAAYQYDPNIIVHQYTMNENGELVELGSQKGNTQYISNIYQNLYREAAQSGIRGTDAITYTGTDSKIRRY